ncbi:MAG: energy-coupling factor transporter transmembrane protein EcfT [Coriobacteriaceae bacterium]|nr:energy-coupling factor transporter transmembrane protein EcfT [Coriobacteriaceae bacterium]
MSAVLRNWREEAAAVRADDVERYIERAVDGRRSVDPRIQMVILVMTNLLATTPTPLAIDVVGVLSAAAVVAYGGRFGSAFKWLVGYAIVCLAQTLCISSGDPLFGSVGGMLTLMRKLYVVAMLAANMVATIRVGELACALQRLKAPRLITIALSMVLRFFPTLAAEAKAVADSMKLRGVRLSVGNVVRHPLKMIEYFAVPLILRVSVVTDEISRAATVRGIDSSHARTSLYSLRIGFASWAFLAWFAGLSVASIAFAQDGYTFMGLF